MEFVNGKDDIPIYEMENKTMFETNQIIVCDPFFGEVFGRTPHRWRTSSANIAARSRRVVRSGASQRRASNMSDMGTGSRSKPAANTLW